MRTPLALLLLSLLSASCARAPVRGPEDAMRKTATPALSELTDDLPLETLREAIRVQLDFFAKSPSAPRELVFGERRMPLPVYLDALRALAELRDDAELLRAIHDRFDFYEVYGRDGWGEVFMTSYFEPVISGSLRKTLRFSQPLYAKPADLLTLDLTAFDPKFQSERKYRARVAGGAVIPYYSREQIDAHGALKDRKLELCWVEPLDSFFLQIQGSGTVVLEDGRRLRLNYAEKNGHSYQSLSNFLRDVIPMDLMNFHTIEAYLRTLPDAERDRLLARNPSYVFFQLSEQSALTYLGVPATDGRTIATDQRYFPKGALAFLVYERPVFRKFDDLLPDHTEKRSRFVLDQDIGGAILGPGRLDLFWGRGADALRYAGAVRGPGMLYYLVPKAD